MIKNKIIAITFIASLALHVSIFLFSTIRLRAGINEPPTQITIAVMPSMQKTGPAPEIPKQTEKPAQKKPDNTISPPRTEQIVYNTEEARDSVNDSDSNSDDEAVNENSDIRYNGDAQNGTVIGEQYETLLSKLRQLINSRLTYPPVARRRNIEGTVGLSLDVGKNGALNRVRVIRSSGSTILDNAAEKLIHDIFPITNAPLSRPEHFTVNIRYSLTDSIGGRDV